MFNIYVNSQKLDVYDLSIITNNLLYDVTAPDKRGVTSSNSFTIPKTANNILILDLFQENVFDVNYESDLYDDTVHILKGNLRIIDIGEKIKIIIVDLLKQFFEDIKKPLHELDLRSYDFTYGYAAYSSLESDVSGAFSFPSYDGRAIGNSVDLYPIDESQRLAHFRPSFNAKRILTEIIEQNGLTADLTNIDIDSLFLSSNAKDFLFTSYQQLTLPQTISFGTRVPIFAVTGTGRTIEFNNSTDIMTVLVVGDSEFNLSRIENIKFGLEIDIDEDAYLIVQDRFAATSTFQEIERHRVNKTARIITSILEKGETNDRRISFIFDKEVTVNSIRLFDLCSEVDLYLYGTGFNFSGGGNLDGWTITRTPTVAMLDGWKIKTEYNLPQWTQKQFFDDVLKMNNLSYDMTGNILSLKYTRGGTAYDITDKIASRSGFGRVVLAQNNFFKFEEDGDVSSDFKLVLDIVNASLDKTLIQLRSSASGNIINDELPSDFELLKLSIYGLSSSTNVNEEDRKILNHRFYSIEAIDDPGNSDATNKCLFDLFFEDLYNDNYSQIFDFVLNAKTITYNAKITQFDYIKIKETGVIYDKVIGRELTVLQINKFNVNRLTEIKAITRETNG